MNPEISLYQTCKECVEKSILSPVGQSICFISPKRLDVSYFAILQAINSLGGLQYGDLALPPATGVMLVDGYSVSGKISSTVAKCESDKDLSKISVLSLKSYNTELKKHAPGGDISVLDAKVIDGLVKYADSEEQPCIIFHDLNALSEGGTLCKAQDFRELHNRLKAKGVTQVYFVNSENDALQIAASHDLIFNITKNPRAGYPTIRVAVHSALAHLQDTILPTELKLIIEPNGNWRADQSISKENQLRKIKVMAIAGDTREEIAKSVGVSTATVCRRLYDLEEMGEVVLKGHDVLEA